MRQGDEEAAFLGRGWAFPPRFDPGTGSVAMLSGKEDIASALWVLLSTYRGERLMLPDFGMPPAVFSSSNRSALSELASRIEAAIIRYEPRVQVLAIEMDDTDRLEGCVRAHIEYEVPAINARANIVYPFYREEGSEFGRLDPPTRGGEVR